MSLQRAQGGLRCKWIVSIKSHSWPPQNGVCFYSEVFGPISSLVIVIKVAIFLNGKKYKRLVKTTSSWIFSVFTLTIPSGGNKEF